MYVEWIIREQRTQSETTKLYEDAPDVQPCNAHSI